ncbi:O-antigen ligase family protein [Mucisphaera sp.]|uniref:O-antigen ligase family protein n=1 Tax=Mucisphaera sp. TaxID=2913024 RepID=UPI003D0B4A3D
MLISMTLSIAVWARPGFAVGLVLCSFVFEQWAQAGSGLFVSYFQLTNYMTGLIVVMAYAATLIKRQMRFPSLGAAGWTMVALYVYCIISAVWSIDRGETIAQLRSAAVYLSAFGLLAPLVASDTKAIRDALLMTVLLGGFLLVTLLLNPNWSRRGVRLAVEGAANLMVRDTGNPLEVASVGGYVAIICALLRVDSLPNWLRSSQWLLVIFGFALIIASESRGQFFAALGVIILFIPFAYPIRSLGTFIGAVFATAIVAGTAVVLLQTFATERFDFQNMIENYSDSRIGTTGILLGAWASAGPLYWFLGLGSSASYTDDLLGTYPHFVPGEVLGELGLFGFAIYFTAYTLTAIAFFRIFRAVKPYPEARSLIATLGALCVFVSLLTLKQGSLLGSFAVPLFFILVGTMDREVRALLHHPQHAPQPIPDQPAPNTPRAQPA